MALSITNKEKEAYRKRVSYWRNKGYDQKAAEKIAFVRGKTQLDDNKSSTSGQSKVKNADPQVGYLSNQNHHRQLEYKKVIASEEESFNPLIFWLQLILCGLGTVVFTLVLVLLCADAVGGTNQAIFWSILTVIPSTILLALPFRIKSIRSWIHKVLALGLLLTSYATMYVSLDSANQTSQNQTSARKIETQQIEKRISDLELRLKPARDAITRFDPLLHRSTIARIQAEAKNFEDDLIEVRKELIKVEKLASTQTSIEVAKKWSMVEWLRRLMLEPLNILCLHEFLECLPAATKMIRRRRNRLTLATT